MATAFLRLRFVIDDALKSLVSEETNKHINTVSVGGWERAAHAVGTFVIAYSLFEQTMDTATSHIARSHQASAMTTMYGDDEEAKALFARIEEHTERLRETKSKKGGALRRATVITGGSGNVLLQLDKILSKADKFNKIRQDLVHGFGSASPEDDEPLLARISCRNTKKDIAKSRQFSSEYTSSQLLKWSLEIDEIREDLQNMVYPELLRKKYFSRPKTSIDSMSPASSHQSLAHQGFPLL